MVVKFTFQAYLVTLAKIQDTPAREVGRSHSSCILSFDLIGQHQNIKTKGFTSRKSFCHSGSQTLFFGGREATTGNAAVDTKPLFVMLLELQSYLLTLLVTMLPRATTQLAKFAASSNTLRIP